MTVYRRAGAAKHMRPTSTVLPFTRPWGIKSRAQLGCRFSRPASPVSFSHFSVVRSSTRTAEAEKVTTDDTLVAIEVTHEGDVQVLLDCRRHQISDKRGQISTRRTTSKQLLERNLISDSAFSGVKVLDEIAFELGGGNFVAVGTSEASGFDIGIEILVVGVDRVAAAEEQEELQTAWALIRQYRVRVTVVKVAPRQDPRRLVGILRALPGTNSNPSALSMLTVI